MDSPSPQFSILERTLSPQQYHDLRKAAGLTPPPLAAVPKALAGSWYSIVVVKNGHNKPTSSNDDIIGMGRLLGDGSLFLLLVDVAVDPEYQDRGVGRLILETLLKYADEYAPDAYISLVGDPPAHKTFYPKFGFKDVEPSRGMYRIRRKRVADSDYVEGE